MAELMVQNGKGKEKMPKPVSTGKESRPNVSDNRKQASSVPSSAPPNKSSAGSSAMSSGETTPRAHGSHSMNTTPSPRSSQTSQMLTPSAQSELFQILTEIRKDQKSHESKLLAMEGRFTDLEQSMYDPESQYCDEQFDEGEYYEESEEVPQSQSSSQVNTASSSRFRNLGAKYNVQENLDGEVDEYLAKIINSVFREGLPEEKFKALVTETGRPSNCEGLTKTRVNNVVWNFLSAEMHSADGKMQAIQDGIVKAASLIVKLLNITTERLTDDELGVGTDALSLLGHSNRLLNIRRKSMHKRELNQEYHHLCSASRPFTDMLYGDDVGNSVKEISDTNKIGLKIRPSMSHHSSHRGRGRGFRGVLRGRVVRPRGRGRGVPRPKNQGVGVVYNQQK